MKFLNQFQWIAAATLQSIERNSILFALCVMRFISFLDDVHSSCYLSRKFIFDVVSPSPVGLSMATKRV